MIKFPIGIYTFCLFEFPYRIILKPVFRLEFPVQCRSVVASLSFSVFLTYSETETERKYVRVVCFPLPFNLFLISHYTVRTLVVYNLQRLISKRTFVSRLNGQHKEMFPNLCTSRIYSHSSYSGLIRVVS